MGGPATDVTTSGCDMNGGQFLGGLDTLLIVKLSSTIIAMVLFVALRWVVRRAIDNYATDHRLSSSRIASARRAVSVMGILVLVGVLAITWSINFQSFMVVSGAILATMGIGFFASWSILSNVTASIIMFWRFPMHVGDRIGLIENDPSLPRSRSSLLFT